VTGALPAPSGAEPENPSLSGEGLASTARISLVSKPPSLLSEHRALPALPRRTSPLPSLKALFPASTPPPSEEAREETGGPTGDADAPSSQEGGELAEVWQKMGQLNEELAHAIQDRDQAIKEGALLREQLRQADEASGGGEGTTASTEELARVTRERDEAIAEGQALREQLHQAPEAKKELRSATQSQELSLLINERDQVRKEYIDLRKQFETLKQEQTPPKEESGKVRKELEQQLDGFRQKLEERNREIVVLKANPGGGGSGSSEGDEKLKEEITSLREQLTRAKEDASVAQRGLALSQKALHETRDTLREATEGTSLSRHNFDNLKNECAILAQQNTVLQSQNDQLSRELGAAKSKLTTRL